MEVVDAVQVHVLRVPGECRLPHAEVQVWSVNPLDGHARVLLDHVQDGVQVADVPLLDILGNQALERWVSMAFFNPIGIYTKYNATRCSSGWSSVILTMLLYVKNTENLTSSSVCRGNVKQEKNLYFYLIASTLTESNTTTPEYGHFASIIVTNATCPKPLKSCCWK